MRLTDSDSIINRSNKILGVITVAISCGLVLVRQCCVAQATPTGSPSIKLSLNEALAGAIKSSAMLKQFDAKLLAANAKLRGASAISNPALSIAKGFGTGTGGLDEDILVTQTLELGDKRRQRVYGARADRDSAKADRDGAVTDLEFAVQSAYFEAVRATAEQKLAVGNLGNAQNLLLAAETQFKAGDTPRSALLRSQIEVSRAEQAATSSETDIANRTHALASLMGMPSTTLIEFPEISYVEATKLEIGNLEQSALRNRSDIISANLGLKSKQAALHSAKIAGQPDLFLEGRHADLNPFSGGTSLRVGITAPFFDFGKIRSDSASAAADVRSQSAGIEEVKRLALLDVQTSYINYEQARKLVTSFQTQRLERSKELLEMAKLGYQKGATSLLEYLDAQQIYNAEQTDYIRALTSYNIAKAALQHAVGGRLP